MKTDESISVAEMPLLLNGARTARLEAERAAVTAPRQPMPAFAPASPVAGVKATGRRLPWAKILGVAAIALVAGAGMGGYIHYAAGFEATDDAFLEGDVHPVSARINGTVSRVLVDDNARVQAGQPLVEIDPADLSLAVRGSEADLAQARANAEQVTAQIAQAQAKVEAATARIAQNAAGLNRAELDFRRMEQLLKAEAVSRQEYDAARAEFDADAAARQSLLAELASDQAGLVAAKAQSAVAQALVQKAEAALSAAKLQVDYTIIRAPNAGRVAKKNVEVGQRLQPGQPVMAVVDDHVWVVANFKENQLAHLRAGQKVRVKVDAVDGKDFEGVVDSFSPGTGAQFSLLPPDNSTGNFTKIVQRVPVKILFANESLAESVEHLAPGLSAIVRVSVRP
jgi:membrane fusion protein (multidrug efflux system)